MALGAVRVIEGGGKMRLNWANYRFLDIDGYGRLGLGNVKALIRAGHDVYPFLMDELDQPAWFHMARGLTFDHLTIQLMPPTSMRNLSGRCAGWSMHESTVLPKGWSDHINSKCQWLIVPSEWLVELFEEDGVKVPIAVVKGCIDPEECPVLPQAHNRPYTFMALADRYDRKGWGDVYSAFYKAFDHNNQDVRLILKCRPGSLASMDRSYSSDHRLIVWREDVKNVADVFARADAAINPTHCEGLGMWPREAAACGIPTAVTEWSGTDDETEQWAIPLKDYTMVDSSLDSGGQWAYVSQDEIIETMRWLYSHQDEAKQKALAGAQWLRNNRTYAHGVKTLMKVIGEWTGHPDDDYVPYPGALKASKNGHKELTLVPR